MSQHLNFFLVTKLVFCYLVFFGSIINVINSRVINPNSVLLILLSYYTLPLLSIVIFNIDNDQLLLSLAAKDFSNAIDLLNILILSIISAFIGIGLSRIINNGKVFKINYWNDLSRIKLNISIYGSFLLIILGMYLYGWSTFNAGYNVISNLENATSGNSFIFFGLQLCGYLLFFELYRSRKRRTFIGLINILILLLIIIYVAVIRGKRLELVIALTPVFLYYWCFSKFFSSKVNRIILLLFSILFLSIIALYRMGVGLNIEGVIFNLFSEGVFAGHSFPGILDLLKSGSLDYEYGIRVLYGLIAVVPGIIWNGKEKAIYALNDHLSGTSPLGATNTLGEIYLQGGDVSVIIIIFMLAFVGDKLFRKVSTLKVNNQLIFLENKGRLPKIFIFYVLYISCFLLHYRDGIIPSIKLLIQMYLTLYLLFKVTLRIYLNKVS